MVLEGNPRRIKRFVNQFNLIWSIVEKKSANSSKKITEYGLVEWLLLREAGLNLVIDLSEKNVEKQVEMFGNITKAAKASSSDIDKVIREYDLSIPSTDLSWSLLKEGKYNFAKNINEYIKLGRYFPVEVTTDTPKQTSFGMLCEQLRKERGYSRAVMAEKMGDITPQAIITWERNGQIPKRDNIKKIKDGLELNETQYNELLSAAGYDTQKE